MKYPKVTITLKNTELVNNDPNDHIPVLGVRYSVVIERENGTTQFGGVAEFDEEIEIDTNPDEPKEDPDAPKEPEETDDQELPTTTEEVIQNLQHNGEDQNFLEREAHKAGVDFDEREHGEPELLTNENENDKSNE